MKIYLISIPHQRIAQIYDFDNEQQIINFAIEEHFDYIIEEFGYKDIDLEEAKDAITYDWNSAIWISSKDDLKHYIKAYKSGQGHQGLRVLSLLKEVGTMIAQELSDE